ncbi:MAG: hypothetical protein EBR82_66955 [Caulobacteraceae bacterium]|nr:hypothetical protein [Caulobacteraceae bacterium]
MNVKAYKTPSIEQIENEFHCDRKDAERAWNYAFESAQERFWEEAQDIAKDLFPDCTFGAEGRCGGWAVVYQLPPVDSWDAVQVAKWASFESQLKKMVKGYCDWENWLEEITVNRWAENGSERYNFIDKKDGTTACIADLKKMARQSGFGAVVRA